LVLPQTGAPHAFLELRLSVAPESFDAADLAIEALHISVPAADEKLAADIGLRHA
jgi:hypothetical protein